ncbi:serine hydrolase [Patescibacteria group bacterium]|nr:serine hydrolase [Patescibacteria group bacterium]
MSPKEEKNNLVIKIKRAFLFVFCLLFFFIPSQNFYAVIQATPLPSSTQELDFPLPTVANYPVNLNKTPMPSLTARSFVVIDRDSAALLVGRNENLKVLPASTVKVMTALVVLDYYRLDDVLVVGEMEKNGQGIDLIEGEKMTVKNLLYGLLVSSANDAALVLAQNYPGGVVGFVKAMNQKAQALNLTHTYFANPTGLDSDPEGNLLTDFSYTTALDLARLAATALKNQFLLEIFSTLSINITDVEGKISHQLSNINELLNYLPGMKGVKTGWTEEAGECLVGYTEREADGIITVVLGSQDRFGETVKLTNWIFDNFRWLEITPSIEN